jgi:hypothetical protein
MQFARAAAAILLLWGAARAEEPAKAIAYKVPDGWVLDAAGAKQVGAELMFLPKASTRAKTDRAITIAYQAKDPEQPAIADLEAYFRVEMQLTLERFPDLQAARWQPRGLDPGLVSYKSIELFGKLPNQPPPHRLLIIDSGDGFYSITFTDMVRERLADAVAGEFFDSIRLESKR